MKGLALDKRPNTRQRFLRWLVAESQIWIGYGNRSTAAEISAYLYRQLEQRPTQMAEASTSAPAPRSVLYCQICTFPPEYCEFGSSATRCKDWLKDKYPALYEKYYSEDAVAEKMQSLSVDAQSKIEKNTAKKEKKALAKAAEDEERKQSAKVTIKRIERNKRKHVTSIHGLEEFGIELKKASKLFATKFATGSSVTKNPQGLDEIVVQGDVADDILEIIEDGTGPLGTLLKVVPVDNVVIVEEGKK